MRTGILAKKLGMSSIFDKQGNRVPVTLLHIEDCQVIGKKTTEKDGYNALVLGAVSCNAKKINKPQKNLFAERKINPKSFISEFRISEDAFIEEGVELRATHFVPGQYIDIRGTSIGKGFAGVMKRWNFSGLRASHGVSIAHRSHGSTGQCQDPGRVPKGKKMAGQLGNKTCTAQNLKVVAVNDEKNLIIVKGSVPGFKGSLVKVFDSVKKALPNEAPYPYYKQTETNKAEVKEEEGKDAN